MTEQKFDVRNAIIEDLNTEKKILEKRLKHYARLVGDALEILETEHSIKDAKNILKTAILLSNQDL